MRHLRVLILMALAANFAAGVTHAELLGDADAGEEVFSQCAGCHEVGREARDRIGPHLNGSFGREAAAHEDYRYSKSMQRAGVDGLIWTAETLDVYIANPRALVSKTRMSFPGVDDPQDHDLDPEILALQGDPEYGAYLATECLTCHQADGTSGGIPSITLWPEEDFVIAMHAYKDKLRPHPVMQMMAGRLSNEEIAALAAFFAKLD